MNNTLHVSPYTARQRQVARIAKALAHPARVLILEFLAQQTDCFCGDLVRELPMSQPTVSQHLRELREAGLIQGTIEAPRTRYCLHRENWALAKALLCDL